MPDSTPVTLGLAPSFGFGDRMGVAARGHVAAMQAAGQGIEPIFAQQSIREMLRTSRTPQDVMNDAMAELDQAGWTGRNGADADHLKTPADIDVTAAAGFTFFTIDPSDGVDPQADVYDESALREKFEAVKYQVEWIGRYTGRQVGLPNGTQVDLTEEACLRAAVKYGPALNHALHLADCIKRVQESAGREYEIELSVDETEHPTTLAEHYMIADQCVDRGMKLVSLAPRFIGDFEKGVDYKGDVAALERSLHDHAAIAKLLGPYKLSLHSGSDKLSMYPALARATTGRFHVKTAGTSYLEALRVVAIHDEPLFRRIIAFARKRYDIDKATYHVSGTVAGIPAPDGVTNVKDLERNYLELWDEVPHGTGFTNPGRQILHCTFGSVLTHADLGPAVHSCVAENIGTYTDVLKDHFVRHLQALRAGM